MSNVIIFPLMITDENAIQKLREQTGMVDRVTPKGTFLIDEQAGEFCGAAEYFNPQGAA